MPIPGPRNQFGPAPGYDNPGLESPDRINLWDRPGAIGIPGRSPGLSIVNLRGNRLAAGQVRRFWQQAVNEIFAQPAFSWSTNSPAPGRQLLTPGPYYITRALRYMTRSLYIRGGVDNTRFAGLHTTIPKWNRGKPVTLSAGQKQNQPTVRNRVSSFGSRVPTLNDPIPAAEDQNA